MSTQANRSHAYLPPRLTHTYYPIQTHTLQHQRPESSNIHEKKMNQSLKNERPRQKQVDSLRRINQQLKERQQIYLQKLMKLQEGLQNQHRQFIKLQDLYTELFESYKQKQLEIMELQIKYRETSRKRQSDRTTEYDQNKAADRNRQNPQEQLNKSHEEYSFREKQWNSMQIKLADKQKEWVSKEREWKMKQNEYSNEIERLNQKIVVLHGNHQRISQQLSFFKLKDKTSNSKVTLNDKNIQQLQEWQRKADGQKENRLKYQYENEFLKNRNKDLQKQRQELEKLLAYKQQEILKLRDEKIKIHRQSSQKIMQKSSMRQSAKRSPLKSIHQNDPNTTERVEQGHNSSNNSLQSNNNQYFSFSRQRNDNSVQSELPSFPPELQIDSIINQHGKK